MSNPQEISRRSLLKSAAVAAPLLGTMGYFTAATSAQVAKSGAAKRKIKLGLVGCGGRGSWIAPLFKENGGYEFHAVADYFQDSADACGNALGVDQARRFSGLSGYKKVIESGVEAIVLQTPPGFFPEHAKAAVEAGVHVYMAKPVAVDVHGCLTIEAAGKLATQKKQAFLVDYQMPTDPSIIQAADLIRKGEIGKPTKVVTDTIGGYHEDQPKTATIESRLRKYWENDIELGGSTLCYFDIHAIDTTIWVLGKRPMAAMGVARILRPHPFSDNVDVYSMVYEYTDGPVHDHGGLAMPTGAEGSLFTRIYGQIGYSILEYFGKARVCVRGKEPFVAPVVDLYPNGARRNIAEFYDSICTERFDNPTVRRAVDGCLTCILGREAGLRNGRMTMEELLEENKRYEIDLTGLKA